MRKITTITASALTLVLLVASPLFAVDYKEEAPKEEPTAVKDHKVPEFFVPPPPFSEDIFPCSDCHDDMDVNPQRRVLEEFH